MSPVRFLLRVMAVALPVMAFAPGNAAAQFTSIPPSHGGGGGGEFEIPDPCAFGECTRRFRRPPRVLIVPMDPSYEVYDEDFDPPPARRVEKAPKLKPKPRVKQAKEKPAKKVVKEKVAKQAPKKKAPVMNAATPSAPLPSPEDRRRPDEVLVEIPLTVTQADIDALAQEQSIEQLGSQEIALINARIHRWRITDRRSVDAVVGTLSADRRVASAQPNHVFTLQQNVSDSAGAPQYSAGKLNLTDAHAVTRGEGVPIAIIDSGIDASHPELAGTIVGNFDAVGGTFKPHAHGTGMAGAISGHSQLNGVAPAARIFAARAFAPTAKDVDGTTFDVLRSMDWSATQGARVFNLSFAGPRDKLLSRAVQAVIAKGIVVVAAAGNAGPKSPPLYPGAEPGVIAVTATDESDALMKQANRGSYLTLAAPGVDILLPTPNGAYAVSSGTSIAAAYVSGAAALVLASNPDADAKEVYEVLTGTARDLGPKGRDKEFGAGLADPAAALNALQPVAQAVATPVR